MKQFALAIVGEALGAFIPCASYQLSRHECGTYPYLWVLVAGGFLFSSFTVFDWARTAFGHSVKAFGFVILTEGVLVLCHTEWISICGLVILALLNATATASNLVRDRTGVIMGACETLNAAGFHFLTDLNAAFTNGEGDRLAPLALVLETYARNPAGKQRDSKDFLRPRLQVARYANDGIPSRRRFPIRGSFTPRPATA